MKSAILNIIIIENVFSYFIGKTFSNSAPYIYYFSGALKSAVKCSALNFEKLKTPFTFTGRLSDSIFYVINITLQTGKALLSQIYLFPAVGRRSSLSSLCSLNIFTMRGVYV